MLQLQASVEMEVMAMKGYPAFSQTPAQLKLLHQIVSSHFQYIN